MSNELPVPTEADGAALFEAQERGRAEVCEVDEAEVRAVGYTPQPRGEDAAAFPQALAAFDDPVVVEAGSRLVQRGLALPEPTSRWAVQASGALLAWFGGVVRAGRGQLLVSVRRGPSADVLCQRRRVFLVPGSTVTLVESTDVPLGAGASPLPVRIEAVRDDVVVADLVADLFAPLDPGEQLTLDLTGLFAHAPARCVADHESVGRLTHGHGLRGRSTRLRPVDRPAFAAYLASVVDELRASPGGVS